MRLEKLSPELFQRLSTLTPRLGAAFASALCARQLPFYEYFSLKSRFGDAAPLRDGLRLLRSAGAGNEVSISPVEDTMEECMDVAPHSDDWPGYEATAAQTAVSVLYAALEYLREPIIEFLARAAMDAIDNADYIDEYSKPRPHKFTFVYPGQDPLPESPLAVAELKRQLRDAAILTDSNVSEDDRVDGIWQLTDRGERIEKPFVI